jgi:glycosyltransferase involved in cell wall biosynthesis
MKLNEITALVLTLNEEANIARTLESVAWAEHAVVIDSFSTDRTLEHVAKRSNTAIFQRRFDIHSAQWNFGLEQVCTPWVLTLDADYVCPDALSRELQLLHPVHEAYAARFRYCVFGKPIRGTLYPPRIVLFRADRFRYRQDGHTQLLDVTGEVGALNSFILHDDRKPLSSWLKSQSEYADLEVKKLLATPDAELGWKDRLRSKVVWAPVLTLFYCLFRKGLILNGWPGIFYTMQRVYAELLLALKLLDQKLK